MIGVNLIDAGVLAARCRKRHLAGWGLALLATGVLAAFPVGIELSRHQKVQALNDRKITLATSIETTRGELNQIAIEILSLESQTARADALRAKRSWSRMLTMFSQTMPEEVWLVSIATNPVAPTRGNKDMRPPPIKNQNNGEKPQTLRVVTMDAPRALTFEGYAVAHRDLYEFMSTLKQTDLFSDVDLTKAVEEPVYNAHAVRFKIECKW